MASRLAGARSTIHRSATTPVRHRAVRRLPLLRPAPCRGPPRMEVAMQPLAPRAAPTRSSRGQSLARLDPSRRYAAATALRAIAQDWDSGRLAFSPHARPPFEAEVLGIVGRRSGLAPAMVVEAGEALEEATGSLQGARDQLAGRLSPLDVLCAEN